MKKEESRSVAATIVLKEDRYLIVKKPRKNHAWQFPQGGVEVEESLLQAAKRELLEECGELLQVVFNEEAVGEYSYLFPEDFKRHEENIIGAKVTFFRAEFVSGEIELDPSELEDYAWVREEKLRDYFEGEYLEVVRNLQL